MQCVVLLVITWPSVVFGILCSVVVSLWLSTDIFKLARNLVASYPILVVLFIMIRITCQLHSFILWNWTHLLIPTSVQKNWTTYVVHDLCCCSSIVSVTLLFQLYLYISYLQYTVEPPNRGHFGTAAFVLSSSGCPLFRGCLIFALYPP